MLVRATVFTLIALCCACSAGGPSWEDKSEFKTDLGDGNQVVADRFALYRAKSGPHCTSTGNGRRVIVTGFGLFSRADFNPSGVIAASLSQGYWPASFAAPTPADLPEPGTDRLEEADYGGRAHVSSLTIEGKSYEVCTLLLEVVWDLAASIIMHEAAGFSPELIIMAGRDKNPDTVTFEHHSFNKAQVRASSYASDGSEWDIAPVQGFVLPALAEDARVDHHWDNAALARGAQQFIAARGYTAVGNANEDPATYICNNVSFVLMNAMDGTPISLAGDLIGHAELRYTPGSFAARKGGFMHLPLNAGASRAEIYDWVKVVAHTIYMTLDNPQGYVAAQ